MYSRESNITRLLSQLNRAVRNFRAACGAHRARPNVATAQRRRDRGLAFLVLRAKVAYVRACISGADFDTAHALGCRYQEAFRAWRGYYDSVHSL